MRQSTTAEQSRAQEHGSSALLTGVPLLGRILISAKNLAMCGGLLQVVAFGAGRFSIDERTR